MRHPNHRVTLCELGCLLGVLVLLEGCGGVSSLNQGAPAGSASAELRGKLLGGQYPVTGAEVQLYAAGSSGYGVGAQALLSPVVFTNSNGDFTISSMQYTCPSNSVMTYLVATGGDPGIGSNNPAIALMAAVGSCGSLSSIAFVNIDEVTTVASVWALAPFLGTAGQVGTSSTNAQGLINAFANVNNLVSLSSGLAPGNPVPASAVMPVPKINTLANILAACVNSSGTTACDTLFTAATPPGGSAPTNTLEAALNIARNPSSNVGSLFAIPTPTSPFQPTLASAPPDWTLAESFIEYGLCANEAEEIGCEPGSIAVDASGNIWAANYFGSVSELSSTGQPLSPSGGFSGGDLNESYGIAVDEYQNVWVTDEDGTNVNNGLGSVTELSSSGTPISGAGGYFAAGVYFPVAIATDTDGSAWIANNGNSTATHLSNDGSAFSGTGAFGAGVLVGPVAVAIDADHNAWFANQSADSGSVTCISSSGSTINTIASGGEETSGIATDSISMSGVSGHVWTANYGSSSVSELELNSNGTATVVSTGYIGGGLDHPNGIAIDGAGNVWLVNYGGNTVTELQGANGSNPGAPISSGSGFGQDASLLRPFGIAIDASGNVWVSNFGSSMITQFVGTATPVMTPVIGPAHLP